MSNIVLVGSQWGDEGKGKIIDLLSDSVDYIVRFQGGNNAGHTMVVKGEQFISHLNRAVNNLSNISWSIKPYCSMLKLRFYP